MPAGRVAEAEPVADPLREPPADPDGAMPPGVGLVEPDALPVVPDDALPDRPVDDLLRTLLLAMSQHCVAPEPLAPGVDGDGAVPELWA